MTRRDPAPIPPPSEVPHTVLGLLTDSDYLDSNRERRDLWRERFRLLDGVDNGKKIQGRLLGIVKGENQSWRYWESNDLDSLVKYITEGGTDPFEAVGSRRDVSESAKTEARDLLEDPAFLWRIGDAVARQGVAGERKTGVVVYLIATTRLMPRATSGVIKALSSAGKNYLLSSVLRLIPSEDVVRGDRLSPQALFYFDKNRLSHKVLTITERGGLADAQASIRWLVSEGELILHYVKKNPKTGDLVTEEKRVLGPTSVLTTTTMSMLKEDDETRNLSLFIDESKEQTRQILIKQADMYDGFRCLSPEELDVFQEAQRSLARQTGKGVFIPYGNFLAKRFPSDQVRARRDFLRLLDLIAAIAFAHQYQRRTDRMGRIVADPTDYHYAQILLTDFLNRTMNRIPPRSEEILQAALDHFDPSDICSAEDIGTNIREFSRADLADVLHWNSDLVRKWIRPLEGTHFRVLEGGQGRTYRYHLMESPNSSLTLPDWQETLGAMPVTGSPDSFQATPDRFRDGDCSKDPEGDGAVAPNASDGGMMCVFDPTKESPICPHCGRLPSSGVSEVRSCSNIQKTSDKANPELSKELPNQSATGPSESGSPQKTATEATSQQSPNEGRSDPHVCQA